MASVFPGALDDFTNPTASDSLDSVIVPHATQHANVNDAIEAIEATLGVDVQGEFVTVDARLAGVETAANNAQSTADDAQTAAEAAQSDVDDLNTALGDPTGSALALVLSQISAEASDELVAGTEPGEVDDSAVAGYVKFTVDGTDFAFPVFAINPAV